MALWPVRNASGSLDLRRRVLRSREHPWSFPFSECPGFSCISRSASCSLFGIVGHIAIGSLGHGDPRSMWLDRQDAQRAGCARGTTWAVHTRSRRLGKYGVWSKVFHATLFLLALIMIVTEISLSLDTLGGRRLTRTGSADSGCCTTLGIMGSWSSPSRMCFGNF